MKRIPRPQVLMALALAAAGLSGCSEFSEQTTTLQYTPADGAQVNLQGDVGIRNAIFLSDGRDAPGTLVASVFNYGDDDVTVSFSGEGINGSVNVDAGQVVTIGPDAEEQLRVPSMGARPGELVPIEVATGAASEQLQVPVLDGTQDEFADLVPTATVSPTTSPEAPATESPTGSSTESPTVSPTTTP